MYYLSLSLSQSLSVSPSIYSRQSPIHIYLFILYSHLFLYLFLWINQFHHLKGHAVCRCCAVPSPPWPSTGAVSETGSWHRGSRAWGATWGSFTWCCWRLEAPFWGTWVKRSVRCLFWMAEVSGSSDFWRIYCYLFGVSQWNCASKDPVEQLFDLSVIRWYGPWDNCSGLGPIIDTHHTFHENHPILNIHLS